MSNTIFFINFCLIISSQQLMNAQEIAPINTEYVFDAVDVSSVIKENNNNLVQLEAFKSISNDRVFAQQSRSDYGKLSWVSIGNPRFLKTPNLRNKSSTSLFHFTHEGFYAYIEMLNKIQMVTLVKAVKTKYKIDVLTDQILNLILSKFQCQLNLYANNEKTILVGKVTEFRNFPLRIQFWAPIGSIERSAFEKRLSEHDSDEHADLQFECQIASRGTELKKNTLTLTPSQMSQLDLTEKLFGPLNIAFITKDQIHSLANELYSSLNVAQEYKMPMNQFDEDFTHDFLTQASSASFTRVSFEEALEKLSNYSRQRLQAQEIKADLEMLFTIKTETINSTENSTETGSCIQFNHEHYKSLKLNTKVNDMGLFLNVIKIGGVIKAAIERLSNDCFNMNRTLNEQLKDLNSDLQSDIQWKIEDNRTLVPSSIHVARLNKFLFSKALTFNRIRNEYYEAPFQRTLSLYTLKYTDVQKAASSASTNSKFLVGTIVALSSRSVLFWFDENGKGFGDYLGWFVCDGRNETPDLTRKFLVGSDAKKEDFDQVGKTGGLNYVNLNVDKLSIYQINIEGLQSVNDLEMNKAKISYSGDTQVYENRPIYHVVTYIIYLDI